MQVLLSYTPTLTAELLKGRILAELKKSGNMGTNVCFQETSEQTSNIKKSLKLLRNKDGI